jgi:hypothetical protein
MFSLRYLHKENVNGGPARGPNWRGALLLQEMQY